MSKSKTKGVVIIGGGGHARVVYSIIKALNDYHYRGYSDNNDNGSIPDYLGNDDMILNNSEKYNNLALGISYVHRVTDKLRRNLIEKFLKHDQFTFPSIISKNSFIDNNVLVGDGSVIVNGSIINTGTVLDKFCVVNTNASIDHDCKIGFNTQVSPGVTILGNVEIGNDVFIGAGSIIMDDISISDNIIVGAGSLVNKNLEQQGIYFGSPAKFIRPQ